MLKYIRSVMSKVSIHVVRNYKNEAKNSRPCQRCINFMKFVNVKMVYYSDDQGKMVKARVATMGDGVVSKGQRATSF